MHENVHPNLALVLLFIHAETILQSIITLLPIPLFTLKEINMYSKNLHVRTYIFPSLAKQVLIFGGSYWQFRLK